MMSTSSPASAEAAMAAMYLAGLKGGVRLSTTKRPMPAMPASDSSIGAYCSDRPRSVSMTPILPSGPTSPRANKSAPNVFPAPGGPSMAQRTLRAFLVAGCLAIDFLLVDDAHSDRLSGHHDTLELFGVVAHPPLAHGVHRPRVRRQTALQALRS